MAIRPILFNTEMVKAILGGQKTQTRRVMKPQAWCEVPRDCAICSEWTLDGKSHESCPSSCVTTPDEPFIPGDILWVRETWSTHYDGVHPDLVYCYKADGIDLKAECLPGENNRWYPSIHMPKEAARIFLLVKDVHAERLHDMDEEAAISEGFPDSPAGTDSPLERFCTLWDKTMKRDDLREFGYHANPWVWVIEFECCDKPEGW